MDGQDQSFEPGALPNGEDSAPVANVLSQYVKDLSFENPNSPAIFQSQGSPKLDVQFNIGASLVGDAVHEVVLKIEARGEIDDRVMYLCELSYAGIFGLRNVPEEHLQPFLLGEAPRILFPFARRVLADAVRDGGFPPLLLEPIDFGALYFAQAQAAAEQGQISGDIGNA